MGAVIKAHWDGEQVVLDDAVDIPANARLIVTILPVDEERSTDGWTRAAQRGLSRAFGDSEPEYFI